MAGEIAAEPSMSILVKKINLQAAVGRERSKNTRNKTNKCSFLEIFVV